MYEKKTVIRDEYGNETGEYELQYSTPTSLRISVSASAGESSTRPFGDIEKYDKVLMTDDIDTPISESTILWIDNKDTSKPYDYIVRKVAKSLNSVVIAVSKVTVNG